MTNNQKDSRIQKLEAKVRQLKIVLSLADPTYYEDYNHKTHSTLMGIKERVQTEMEKCLDYKLMISEGEFDYYDVRIGWVKWIGRWTGFCTTWSDDAIIAVIKHFIKKKYVETLKKMDKMINNNGYTYFDYLCQDGYLEKKYYIKCKELIALPLNQKVLDILEQRETEGDDLDHYL